MKDITSNKHGGSRTSEKAFDRVEKSISTMQRIVLQEVSKHPEGATCAEVAKGIGREMHSISGRFTELKRDGMIYQTDSTRGGGYVHKPTFAGTLQAVSANT